ncbi:LysE family transporter [Streptomyces netropsis]|uniref:LysE family translocator n=1 Tax=Streptomyces netropsis TaxID=55404 RepID=UPI0030D074EC
MITPGAIGAFALIAGLLTPTPGLDAALILCTVALGHHRRAWGVVLGVQSGTLAWGTLTSLGVTALLTASHLVYETLRWAGAAYLVWMGGRLLWTAWRHSSSESPQTTEAETKARVGAVDTLLGGWRQARAISSTRRWAPSTLRCSRSSSWPTPRTLL